MESLSDILFHAEEVQLPPMLQPSNDDVKTWLFKLIESEGRQLVSLNFVFCSDEYLLKINQQYLDHDNYTDIITFDNSDVEQQIEGDIFISLDRVAENAKTYKVAMEHELKRVMAHGVLHLSGYNDKTEDDIATMRSKEAAALDASLKYIS